MALARRRRCWLHISAFPTSALCGLIWHRRRPILNLVAILLLTYLVTGSSLAPTLPVSRYSSHDMTRSHRSLHHHLHLARDRDGPWKRQTPHDHRKGESATLGWTNNERIYRILEGVGNHGTESGKPGGNAGSEQDPLDQQSREDETVNSNVLHDTASLSEQLLPSKDLPRIHKDSPSRETEARHNVKLGPVAGLHLSLEGLTSALPDVIHIPFEDVVEGQVLRGWEDEWLAHASYDQSRWGDLREPQIDFVYLWVNGSDEAFEINKRPYELQSVLNGTDGKWIRSHGINRYRHWDELRYSIRSIEEHASTFLNKIQIVVNSVEGSRASKQRPTWLNEHASTTGVIEVFCQEEVFDLGLPADVQLTYNREPTLQHSFHNRQCKKFFALSDDMLLGKPHAASDIYSPLFGPVMGFKTNSYSATSPPSETDAHRFGEKPYLIYTSWLLNKRFGVRKRKGQSHFGHSLSRSVMREALSSFPGPELESACKRFRGEPGFQLYSWYASFHYLIERHREALLWSYIILRSDVDCDGYLSSGERKVILQDLQDGMKNEGKTTFRKRNYYHVAELLRKAGLEAPKVNTDILWTSLDGPQSIRDAECRDFDVNECLGPGFSILSIDSNTNPLFSAAVVFDRVSRQLPRRGDCLLKLVLNKIPRGLSALLPDASNQAAKRELAVKAVMRYQYTVINPDALFVMVTDAEQVDSTLISRFVRGQRELPGQLCLNDDVSTEDPQELADLMEAMAELYQGLFPQKNAFEK